MHCLSICLSGGSGRGERRGGGQRRRWYTACNVKLEHSNNISFSLRHKHRPTNTKRSQHLQHETCLISLQPASDQPAYNLDRWCRRLFPHNGYQQANLRRGLSFPRVSCVGVTSRRPWQISLDPSKKKKTKTKKEEENEEKKSNIHSVIYIQN